MTVSLARVTLIFVVAAALAGCFSSDASVALTVLDQRDAPVVMHVEVFRTPDDVSVWSQNVSVAANGSVALTAKVPTGVGLRLAASIPDGTNGTLQGMSHLPILVVATRGGVRVTQSMT